MWIKCCLGEDTCFLNFSAASMITPYSIRGRNWALDGDARRDDRIPLGGEELSGGEYETLIDHLIQAEAEGKTCVVWREMVEQVTGEKRPRYETRKEREAEEKKRKEEKECQCDKCEVAKRKATSRQKPSKGGEQATASSTVPAGLTLAGRMGRRG